jgi:hypothetical protein
MQEYGSVAFLYSAPGDPWIYAGQPLPYLGLIDPMTGEELAKITETAHLSGFLNRVGVEFLVDAEGNAPGSILAHYTSGGNLTMWNSTRLFYNPQGRPVRDLQPSGNISFSMGIEWSVPLPSELNGVPISLSITRRTSDVILLRSAPTMTRFNSAGYQITAAYDTRTGEKLWGPLNQTIPLGGDTSVVAAGEGVFVAHNKDLHEAYGYSLETGAKLWGPVALEGNAWSYIQRAAEIAYGKVYIFDFGGYTNALDLQTGEIVWTFNRGNAGLDTPYGIYPFWYNAIIADGKLFLSEGSMYNPPLHPAKRVVINCTTGEMVWSILSYSGRMPGAVADGYLLEWNSFDNQIYTYGKGPTETTVMVSPKVSTWGGKVLFEGTVMDISPGTNQLEQSMRFPKGVAAVADESMSEWMEYVYMQQKNPSDTIGVPVKLEVVVDPNGNWYDIGTTTTDATGFFKISWEPPVPGEYLILASFAGSDSYYGSYVETAIFVDEGLTPGSLMETEFLTTAGSEQTTVPLISTEAVIVAAFAIVCIIGLTVYWQTRKEIM